MIRRSQGCPRKVRADRTQLFVFDHADEGRGHDRGRPGARIHLDQPGTLLRLIDEPTAIVNGQRDHVGVTSILGEVTLLLGIVSSQNNRIFVGISFAQFTDSLVEYVCIDDDSLLGFVVTDLCLVRGKTWCLGKAQLGRTFC